MPLISALFMEAENLRSRRPSATVTYTVLTRARLMPVVPTYYIRQLHHVIRRPCSLYPQDRSLAVPVTVCIDVSNVGASTIIDWHRPLSRAVRQHADNERGGFD